MTQAKLNNEHIATVAGDITVYNYDSETREYLSSSIEYLPVGVGIPANSCIDAPGESEAGFAICRTDDFSTWELVADHRGETVYMTESGEAVTITALGDYPKDTTTLKPVTPYDIWNGSAWVTDKIKMHSAEISVAEQKKTALVAVANAAISPLQDAVELDIATDEEARLYAEWRKYRVLLNRVDILTAPNVEWPAPPV
ncbi:TPA: tail fiber assembly protein [Klebsiella pneumoniae]